MARHKHKQIQKSPMSMITGLIKTASPIIQFIQQITEKDLAQINANIPAGSTIDAMDNAKNIINIVVGRMTGFSPFKDAYKAQFKLNPSGIINKWTIIDAAMIAYGEIGKHAKWLPKHGLIGSIGKSSLPAAAFGGLLDAPISKAPDGSRINFAAIPPAGQNTRILIPNNPSYSQAGYQTSMTMELNK